MAAVGGTTRSGGDDDAQQGERSSGHTRPERTRRLQRVGVESLTTFSRRCVTDSN